MQEIIAHIRAASEKAAMSIRDVSRAQADLARKSSEVTHQRDAHFNKMDGQQSELTVHLNNLNQQRSELLRKLALVRFNNSY